MRPFPTLPIHPRGTILVALLLITLPTACKQDATPVPTPIEVDLQAEEESVYEALFAEIYGEPRIYVLMEQSSPGMEGVEALESIIDTYLPRFSDLEAETAESFQSRNETATSLPPGMDIGLPYVLLTQADFDGIFALNTSGWNVFYTRYPNSPGMTTVSRVGFNRDLTQAFVYAGTWSNWLAGAGYYYLLEKVDGSWVILQQVMAWIS
jgi:hypothetical protein